MDERETAIGLQQSISAPNGAVSVSVWYDKGTPYLKVYLSKDGTAFCGQIPNIYNGYAVVVETMPAFGFLN